jgi:hypothetical protein
MWLGIDPWVELPSPGISTSSALIDAPNLGL